MILWRRSRQALLAVLAGVAFATAGCEDVPIVTSSDPLPGAPTPAEPPVTPPPSAAPTASVPTTAPSASAAPSAAASGSAAPADDTPLPFGDFSGPAVKPAVKQGDRAWVVVPLSGGWEAVKLTVAPVLEVGEDSVVVVQGERRYRVPGAFTTRAAPATGLKKGDPVMASAKGSRVFGRVVDADATKANVRFKFAGAVEIAEIAAADIVKLDGSAFVGAPVSFKENKIDHSAQLAYLGKDRAWVVRGGRAHPVAATDVTVLPAPTEHAKGATITAPRADAFTPGLIVEVLDEGLQFKVKWDGGDETATITFEWVRKPAPAPTPAASGSK